jgi:hypothetical protein
MSMGTRDQAYLDCTELEAAIEYAEIAAEYEVPVTLFCTGKCVHEEPERMAKLAAMDNVELGGHNYWAFTTPVHKAWRALEKVTGGRVGSWMGPRAFQTYEIRKTIDAFAGLGVDVRCWRDHAYRHDKYTHDLLSDLGITHLSDAVEPSGKVRHESQIVTVPINTMPDHEHIYHSYLTPSSDAEREFEGPFGSKAYSITEWRDRVIKASRISTVGTVLAHPACMKIADEFEVFIDICVAVSDLDTRYLSEVSV